MAEKAGWRIPGLGVRAGYRALVQAAVPAGIVAAIGVGVLVLTQPENQASLTTEEAVVLDDAASGLAFATDTERSRADLALAKGAELEPSDEIDGSDDEATSDRARPQGESDTSGGSDQTMAVQGSTAHPTQSFPAQPDYQTGTTDGHLSQVIDFGGLSGLSTAGVTQPNEPTASKPTTTTAKPTTTAEPTAKPTTTASSTTAPSTTAPSTTAPSTTAPSTTAPSTTADGSESQPSTSAQTERSVAQRDGNKTNNKTNKGQGDNNGKKTGQSEDGDKPKKNKPVAGKPTTTGLAAKESKEPATTTTVLATAAATTTTTMSTTISSTTVQDVVTTLSTLATTTLVEQLTTSPSTSALPSTSSTSTADASSSTTSTTTSTTNSTTTTSPSTTTSTPPSSSTSGSGGGSSGGSCSPGSAGGVFRTSGTDILNPCGRLFVGGGFNVAYNMFDYPYVYQGTDNGVFDVWLTDPGNGGYYPGGGVSSGRVWDPTSGSQVDLPDRYYAVNGSATPGVSQPNDHWNQKFLRVNLVSQGEGGSPNVSDTLATAVPDIYEGINYGVVQMIEAHDLTGQNISATGSWNDTGSSFSGSFGNVVRLIDGLVDEFGVGNSGGGSARQEGYVWFNPTNEPWGNSHVNGCPPAAFFDTQTFWIQRIRNYHNAENVIVIDASEWGQDLRAMAKGCYDSWWQSLKNHSSGDLTRNLVMSWHAYGSRIDGGYEGYTYATMDADLASATAKFPLLVGEYGEPAGSGVNFAGPYEWNQTAVSLLLTDGSGPALADKYDLLMGVWHATGDSSYGHIFKIVRGPSAQTLDGKATPFWDIESGGDSRLENLGRRHWNYSHRNG